MSELNISESIWSRGWRDTKKGFHTIWFWLAEFIGGGLVSYLINPLVGIIVVILGFFILWIGATAGAPFRQRNEARATVEDLTSRSLIVTPRIEYPSEKSVRVYIDIVNETKGTIHGVIACIDKITNGVEEAKTKPMIGRNLVIDGPSDHTNPSKSTTDLHPGQSVTFGVAGVGTLPGKITFLFPRTQRMTTSDGRVSYGIAGERHVPAGHLRVSVVVRGEDANPEIMLFEFDSTETEVKVRNL